MFIFLLVMVMLTPLVMILFGALWRKTPPKEINDVYGYRTTRSMKNKDTWDYAHKYFGKLWFLSGWFLFVFSMVFMFIMKSNYENASIYIIGFQIIIIFITILPTEFALRKNFDQNGNRI
jgi:uncharacterized membrane protein